MRVVEGETARKSVTRPPSSSDTPQRKSRANNQNGKRESVTGSDTPGRAHEAWAQEMLSAPSEAEQNSLVPAPGWTGAVWSEVGKRGPLAGGVVLDISFRSFEVFDLFFCVGL